MAAIGAGAVLVGGGIGFNLVDALVDHGDEVTVTDDASTSRRENVARARPSPTLTLRLRPRGKARCERAQ